MRGSRFIRGNESTCYLSWVEGRAKQRCFQPEGSFFYPDASASVALDALAEFSSSSAPALERDIVALEGIAGLAFGGKFSKGK